MSESHDQVAQVFRDETMLPLTELSDEATGEAPSPHDPMKGTDDE
jgi:hypothetical protein